MSSALPSDDMKDLSSLRLTLRTFASSLHTFQILRTLPVPTPNLSKPPKTLYILDSSFNPPTLAHLRICTSALLQDRPEAVPKRLLLLLATQNADKAPQPAPFEQRLAMMSVFAEELVRGVTATTKGEAKDGSAKGLGEEDVIVDVGVTKEARFVNKARVLENCDAYSYSDDERQRKPVEQVHLIGYDTLIRLLDTKYYPPTHTLAPLEGLFEKHRVRVTRREDDGWGGGEEQDEYLRALERGDREVERGKKAWAKRIELVEGRKEEEEAVSSTKVRNTAKEGDGEALEKLVPLGVGRWTLDEKLYLDDG